MPEAVHDQLLDSVPDGMFTLDSEWRITAFNRAAAARALGINASTLFRKIKTLELEKTGGSRTAR